MSAAGPAPDTIFALSSGALPAAIAIVRISGPCAGNALRALTGRLPEPRRAVLSSLRDADRLLLDRAMVLWLPGPNSATGEDLAELHLHGGRATVRAVLARLATLPGLVPAGPGAFTRRALANGRLDLAEAEGLADLLVAETEGQRRAAMRMAEGGLGRLIEGWSTRLLTLSAGIEAGLEFGEEEEDVGPADPAIATGIAALHDDIAQALAAPPAERLRDGVRIVIAGPVNAGKSSLLNALCGRDAAIATPHAGTTRDLIEVPIVLDGIACILIDSAGLRAAQDPAERIGVERATKAMAEADLILWLGDAAHAPERDGVMTVHARADLPERKAVSAHAWPVSIVSGEGLSALRRAMVDRAKALLPAEDRLALNARHRHLLGQAAAMLADAERLVDELALAEMLRMARIYLDRVTGRAGTEDMLDALFARFCIGK